MANTERILAVDPGETTGWAYFVDGELDSQGTIDNAASGVSEALMERLLPGYTQLVLESFIVEPDFVGRAHASEVIGVMIHDATMSLAPYAFQSRGQKATVIRGTETERFNWLRGHGFEGTSHELDAISHGLLRLRLMGHKDTVRRYWGTTKAPTEAGASAR